jgi:hypothetical protein
VPGSGWRPDRPWRPTTEQLEYRRSEVARLHRAGHTIAQIQEAMRPRIGKSTVWNDLEASGIRQARRQGPPPPVPPETVSWAAPPLYSPGSGPADRVALIVRHFLAEMAAARYEPAHANEVLDARNRGDEGWLSRWCALIADLEQVTAALRRQHGEDGDLRQALLGWAAPAGPPAPPARPGLREEIRSLVAAGLPVTRGRLAARYGVGEHVVQGEHTRAVARHHARQEMAAEGWRPPGTQVP